MERNPQVRSLKHSARKTAYQALGDVARWRASSVPGCLGEPENFQVVSFKRCLSTDIVDHTNPVFGRLTHERALRATGAGITLDRMTAGADQVIELGQFDDDSIIL